MCNVLAKPSYMMWNVQTSLCLLPFAELAHDHRLIWQSTSVQCCQSETVTDHYCKAIWSTRVEKHVLNECHLAGVASNVGSRSLESSRTVWGCITPQHTPHFRGIFFSFLPSIWSFPYVRWCALAAPGTFPTEQQRLEDTEEAMNLCCCKACHA